MEQRNNKQNSVIFQIEDLLKKMSNQVNFLIRNEETMTQLDLDLMMKNTRKLYDKLCSIEIEEELGIRNDELGIDADTDADLENQRLIESETEDDDHVDMIWDFAEVTNDNDNVDDVDDVDENNSEPYDVVDNQDNDLEANDVNPIEEDNDSSDNIDEEIEVKTDEIVEEEEENIEDTESANEEDSGIRAYKIVNNEYYTLGDKLEHTEDHSLAARLQRKPVSDLMTAIGINDKFLLLNELFNGSMEKYNKSIRALNSFSTLLGARTYMSELQIEFQWDCESEAYKKLNDLIERRFISIHNS